MTRRATCVHVATPILCRKRTQFGLIRSLGVAPAVWICPVEGCEERLAVTAVQGAHFTPVAAEADRLWEGEERKGRGAL